MENWLLFGLVFERHERAKIGGGFAREHSRAQHPGGGGQFGGLAESDALQVG